MEVLLGVLAIEPMSGYDLGLTIRQSVGHFWNESYGQIYPVGLPTNLDSQDLVF